MQEHYFWSDQSWPLGQSRNTKTMAHGYVYHNKLTNLKQEMVQIILLSTVSS